MGSRVGMTAEKTVKNRTPNLYNQIFICNNFLLFVQYLRPMGHLNTITPQLLLNDKGDNVQQYNNTTTPQHKNASTPQIAQYFIWKKKLVTTLFMHSLSKTL